MTLKAHQMQDNPIKIPSGILELAMTIDEFSDTGFGPGMFAIYKGGKYQISAVDFDEALVALEGVVGADQNWVRCENIEITHFEPNPSEGMK